MSSNCMGYATTPQTVLREQLAPALRTALYNVSVVAGMGFILSCGLRPQIPDRTDVIQPHASFTATLADEATEDAWWTTFRDPTLDQLIERSIQNSATMEMAWARISQAQAAERAAQSGRFPTLDLDASAGRSRALIPGPAGAITLDTFTIQASTAYEIDVWGRVRAGRSAAQADTAALRADLESTALALAGDIVDAWIDLRFAAAQQALINDQLDLATALYEVVLMRVSLGEATALDVYQQRRQIEALEAQRRPLETQAEVAQIRLAILAGEPPGVVRVDVTPSELPALPQLPSAGVPSELLLQRPDIRAAMHRLESADNRLALALIDRLPQLRLRGTLGLQSRNLTELFDDFVWSFVGSIAAPLFDGGRRRAEVERHEAIVRERLAFVRATWLSAIGDVELALAREHGSRATMDALARQVDTAQHALFAARQQFQEGVIDYARVLTALQDLQRLEQEILATERQLLTHRVLVCRALGGMWTQELFPPHLDHE